MIDTQITKLLITHEQVLSNNDTGCFEVSVPFPKSLVLSTKQLSLKMTTEVDEVSVDALYQVNDYWPDNSIKWIKLTYQYSATSPLFLMIATNRETLAKAVNYSAESVCTQRSKNKLESIYRFGHEDSTLIFDPTTAEIEFEQETGSILSLSTKDIELRDDNDALVEAVFDNAYFVEQTSLNTHLPSAVQLIVEGHFSAPFIQFQLTVNWLATLNLIRFDLCIHNANRAIHSNGKWDLGDPGAFRFNELNIALHTSSLCKNEQITLSDIQNSESYSGDKVECQQFSSGGDNWQSPVHVNHENKVELNKNGFELSYSDKKTSGKRCQPVVNFKNQLAISIDKFWQNFPKSLSAQGNSVILGLFPDSGYKHELQGGEKKTHTFWASFNGDETGFKNNHTISQSSISWDWINQCNLYPFFARESSSEHMIQPIIDLGIDATVGFDAKREKLDEYGWRNFGELYADHETAGYKGDTLFVSHYNNQYDPIFGFLRQYLTTGNTKWFELADDLATHVKDIDIYHTELDKNEYNGGLFWHTDHYLQAFTSSHRSYSKHQASDAYQDHAGGGGPGGQHCYTSGLYLHFCLTGNQSSKEAVLTLTHWITHVYEGSGTCLELLLAFKNRHVPGYKNHFTGQYPLDRGIANYVHALLDSYELTNEISYLTQAQNVLSCTLHPDEDLTNRNLHDIENTWFYTVLLQALCRFLLVKESRQEFDHHFYYCRDCLLNFAEWMIIHEYPYLDKPEILEYPNDTWTAQDLRKAHVLAAAFYYSANRTEEFLIKAQFFEKYVADKLNFSDTKTYTRILVLLMQNQGMVDFFKGKVSNTQFASRKTWPLENYQHTSMLGGLLRTFTKRLIKISVRAEWNWLKKRLA